MARNRDNLEQYYENPTISGRIVRLMTSKGYSKYDLAKKAGVSASTLTTSLPNNTWSTKNLTKISKHFNVSVEWLMSGKDQKNESNVPLSASFNDRPIKVFERIAAGPETELFDNPMDIINLSHPLINNLKGEIVGFYVKGDSMRPRITEGDTVITKMLSLPNEKPRNKDMIVTVFNRQSASSEGNLKLFTWQNKDKGDFILSSINPYISPQFHNMNEVRYMFRVYLVISKVDYK